VQTLTAGQNAELSQRNLRFSFEGSGYPVVLLLDERGHASSKHDFLTAADNPSRSGVAVSADHFVDICVDQLPVELDKVQLAAVGPNVLSGLTCRLAGEADGFVFSIDTPAMHPAMICLELYRRKDSWRVRAIGQGYSGGLTELLRAHQLSEQSASSPIGTSSEAVSGTTPGVQPLGDGNPLERISMIHEDAARITASLLSSNAFAESRFADEMSVSVADPANRNGPAAERAAAAAGRRRDELCDSARTAYERDAAHLTAELVALDAELPAALAPWGAACWRTHPIGPSNGIRLGSVSVPGFETLRLPFCVPAPMRRPLWIDTDRSEAASSVAAAAVMRLLAAASNPASTLDIIDVGAEMRQLWQPLSAYLLRPIVTEVADVGPRLRELAAQADLAALRRSTEGTTAPGGVVLITDFGYATPDSALADAATLINLATESNLSVIFIGDANWDAVNPSPLLRSIIEYSIHVPGGGEAHISDPWTNTKWRFVPDGLSIERLVQVSAFLSGHRQ